MLAVRLDGRTEHDIAGGLSVETLTKILSMSLPRNSNNMSQYTVL
jgi:hypothetical protein